MIERYKEFDIEITTDPEFNPPYALGVSRTNGLGGITPI
jgi:hypothetical protein